MPDGERWVITLDMPRPPKGLHANDRPSHWSKARATKELRSLVYYKVMSAKVPTMYRCRVDVEWVVKTRAKRDLDNLAPMLKVIYDAVGSDRGISAHVVPDDDPAHMEKPGATIRYDKLTTPYFRVTITRRYISTRIGTVRAAWVLYDNDGDFKEISEDRAEALMSAGGGS
ncbi:hypothetical protein [Subtercola endophyticus]|uniref:hypothetical protein n=1 Tax=Subtercola endophyticus TaxID=2895559 RepID=UPI001E52ADD7|nr:hypothetical protein [Subtercola endophyticus]UFS59499.1 hypothetical protein LQ955_01475 [Subtercola endophyticus]